MVNKAPHFDALFADANAFTLNILQTQIYIDSSEQILKLLIFLSRHYGFLKCVYLVMALIDA